MILFFYDYLPFLMSSILNSQCLVLATAMAVSAGTVFLFEIFRDKNFPITQTQQQQEEYSSPDSTKVPKSCLCSESKKNEKKKKKKKVQFAKDVKDSTGNGELYRKQQEQRIKHAVENRQSMSCGKENLGKIPANRMALYNGILKNRVQYSH